MKIILINQKWEKIGIWHNPLDVTIHPKAKTVDIIQGRDKITYRYFMDRPRECNDTELDTKEYAVEILVGERIE